MVCKRIIVGFIFLSHFDLFVCQTKRPTQLRTLNAYDNSNHNY